MIKSFLQINDEDIKYIMSHPVSIHEKLDLIYFKVDINSVSAIPLKTPMFNAISDVDCIVNEAFRNIVAWTNEYIEPIREYLFNTYGHMLIGIFYAPAKKTKVIDYKNIEPNWYCLDGCQIDGDRHREEDASEYILSAIPDLDYNVIYDSDWGLISNGEIDEFKKSLTDDRTALQYLVRTCGTQDWPLEDVIPSRSDYDTAEGVVIRSGNKVWQLQLNDATPHIEKEGKRLYRDTILSSLAHELLMKTDIAEEIANSNDNYVDKVCRVFEEYMNTTDIFSKVSFEPDDLLPPIDGYIGDMDLSAFKSETVKTICRYNETASNILRMFLHTFTHSIRDNKFETLSRFDQTQLNGLIKALKYRNYADIALNIARK